VRGIVELGKTLTHLFEPHNNSMSSSLSLSHAMSMRTFAVFRGAVVHRVDVEVPHREKVVLRAVR